MPPADQHSNVCLNFGNIIQWPYVSSPFLALFLVNTYLHLVSNALAP